MAKPKPVKTNTTIIDPDETGYDLLESSPGKGDDGSLRDDSQGNYPELGPTVDTSLINEVFDVIKIINNGGLMQNPGNNQFLTNMFQGNIKPVVRKRRNKPAFEEKIEFPAGKDGNYNVIKCFVHYPTLEYPETSVFFQASNANSSTFMRLENTTKLEEISAFIAKCATQIEAIMPKLKEHEMIVDQQYNQYQNQLKMMQAMMNQPADQEE